MNCIACTKKSCRSTASCGAESFDIAERTERYHEESHQKIVQQAAQLVDGGKAGELSRIEELIEFSKNMGYKKVGLAYCYGMEALAGRVMRLFRAFGVPVTAVCCTVGGVSQQAVNEKSELPGVSCNPVNQAAQLEAEGADLAVTIGLCLGHDILFRRNYSGDTTNLVVKDRRYGHAPIDGIDALTSELEL